LEVIQLKRRFGTIGNTVCLWGEMLKAHPSETWCQGVADTEDLFQEEDPTFANKELLKINRSDPRRRSI